jgi:hypothetical protein
MGDMKIVHGTKRYAAILGALALVTSLGGCTFAMRDAETDLRQPPPGQALITFIRLGSDKDRVFNVGVAITDDKGHFVAGLQTNERAAIPVAPGRYVFVAFKGFGSKIKLFYDEEPSPIPCLVVEARAGRVYYVAANLLSLPEATDWYNYNHRLVGSNKTLEVVTVSGGVGSINQGLYGTFGGTRLVPLADRLGTLETEIPDLLQRTHPREVNPEGARSLEEDVKDHYYWQHGWQSGVANAALYSPQAVEQQTLHETDGFPPR